MDIVRAYQCLLIGALSRRRHKDSTNSYAKGDKVTYNGKTWVSEVDNNIWEPGVYGWEEVYTK